MKTSSLTHSKEKLTEWEMKLSRMRNSQQVKYNFNVLGFTVSLTKNYRSLVLIVSEMRTQEVKYNFNVLGFTVS